MLEHLKDGVVQLLFLNSIAIRLGTVFKFDNLRTASDWLIFKKE